MNDEMKKKTTVMFSLQVAPTVSFEYEPPFTATHGATIEYTYHIIIALELYTTRFFKIFNNFNNDNLFSTLNTFLLN